MKGFILLAAVGLLIGAGSAQATIIFQDDFESGNLNNWTTDPTKVPVSGVSDTPPLTTPLTALSMDNTMSVAPGMWSARSDYTHDRMFRNFGVELGGASAITTFVYDAGPTGGTRTYVQAVGWSGAGWLDGDLSQLFAIGKYNAATLPGEAHDGNFYQGRVLSGDNAGWFNLNGPGAPVRSVGWHKFTIARESDGSTIKFYVDDVLSRTITGATVVTLDSITMGFNAAYPVGDPRNDDLAWYDNVTVEVVPEPTTMVAGALLLLPFGVGTLRKLRNKRTA